MQRLLLSLAILFAAGCGVSAKDANERGRGAMARSDYRAAIAAYSEAVAAEPSIAKHHYNLGLALGHSGYHAQAAEEFRAALSLDPTFPNARRGLEVSLRAVEDGIASEVAARVQH